MMAHNALQELSHKLSVDYITHINQDDVFLLREIHGTCNEIEDVHENWIALYVVVRNINVGCWRIPTKEHSQLKLLTWTFW